VGSLKRASNAHHHWAASIPGNPSSDKVCNINSSSALGGGVSGPKQSSIVVDGSHTHLNDELKGRQCVQGRWNEMRHTAQLLCLLNRMSPKTDATTYESKWSTGYEADKLKVERSYFFNKLSNFSRSKSLPMKTSFRMKCKMKAVSSSSVCYKERGALLCPWKATN
jgi:hypothetical protein